ncbi:MAG TPA: substrate-binding domain-containing protein [Planctomycetota bacterium]|nr:substrate-binding domain-containing protein [Planctomycetota bacterium]
MASSQTKPLILLLYYGASARRNGSFMSSTIEVFEKAADAGEIELYSTGTDISDDVLREEAQRADGIVTISIGNDLFLNDLGRLNKPMVVLDHDPLGGNADSVCFDNFAAAEELGKKIVALGHRDVLYVSRFAKDLKAVEGANPHVETTPSSDRRNGLARAFEGTDVTLWSIFPWYSGGGGISNDAKTDARWRFANTIQQVGKMPDCIVNVDYSVSEEFIAILAEHNLQVPRDLSMADFQIFPRYEKREQLPMSHMRLDFTQMGQKGWRLLRDRLHDRELRNAPPRRVRLKCAYVDEGTLHQRGAAAG